MRTWCMCMVRNNKSGGGSTTTEHGNKFENDTDLLKILEKNGYEVRDGTVFFKQNVVGSVALHSDFYHVILHTTQDEVSKLFGFSLIPDTAFFNKKNQTLYIIEKKYQESSGSVDEKLQTCEFKLRFYNKAVWEFNNEEIKHVRFFYIFNDYYSKPKYDEVRRFIQDKGCDYYFDTIELSAIGL